jgi:hypothetical protein
MKGLHTQIIKPVPSLKGLGASNNREPSIPLRFMLG